MQVLYRVVLVVMLASVLGMGVSHAAEGDFILKNEKAYRVVRSTETVLKDCETYTVNTNVGEFSWILVDPSRDAALKGAKSGVYLFHGDGKSTAFLPVQEEVESYRLYISPSGKKLLVSWGMEYIKHLSLYQIDKNKGFSKIASFEVAGPPIWIDEHRFVFNAINAGKGARVKGKFDLWWSSVLLYDSAMNESTVIKEATATKDYTLNGFDGENDMLEIMESTVKNVQDWADEDKVKDTELKLPVPAAG